MDAKVRQEPVHAVGKAGEGLVMERVIVSMTSFPKRIGNVGLTVFSILQGTKTPDLIICNLAESEFPNKEQSIPDDLALMARAGKVILNWLPYNTKQFKKIIPTMEQYPDDVIISIDDDLIYPKDFVETMINDYVRHGRKFPITAGHYIDHGFYKSKPSHHGSFSLVKRSMFGSNFGKMQQLVKSHLWKELWFDDPLYTYAIMNNNLEYKLATFNGHAYKASFKVNGISDANNDKRWNEHQFLLQQFRI